MRHTTYFQSMLMKPGQAALPAPRGSPGSWEGAGRPVPELGAGPACCGQRLPPWQRPAGERAERRDDAPILRPVSASAAGRDGLEGGGDTGLHLLQSLAPPGNSPSALEPVARLCSAPRLRCAQIPRLASPGASWSGASPGPLGWPPIPVASRPYLQPGVEPQPGRPGAAGQDGNEEGPGLALPLHRRGVGQEGEAVGLGPGAVLPVLDLLVLHLWGRGWVTLLGGQGPPVLLGRGPGHQPGRSKQAGYLSLALGHPCGMNPAQREEGDPQRKQN